jgi:hypothetical protein
MLLLLDMTVIQVPLYIWIRILICWISLLLLFLSINIVIREKEKCGHGQQLVEQVDIYISATSIMLKLEIRFNSTLQNRLIK